MTLAFLRTGTRTRGPEREFRDRPPHVRARPRRLILALTATLAFAAPQLSAVELAPGLAYLRPGADIAPQTGSIILDLRMLPDDEAAAPLLTAVEPGTANPRRVIIALVSPETPVGVRRQLAALPRCLTVGRVEPEFRPHIAVTTTAEADQRASTALAAGTAPEALLTENSDKPRYDEAMLIREHTVGPAPLVPPESSAAAAPETAESAPSPKSEPVPFDAVLQRAVHIYRGLVILKKA